MRCEVRDKVIALLQSLDGGIYLPHDRTIDLPEGEARR